ncbi:glycerol-3-phosphate 1-O-acyltransferase PlsB [Pseudoalteromonas luteoviolacea]|uniref:Glycerol-3-phosphate acyltransferase n=1 Tax=Pseudoalteromonas luteoviolacea S4054 TaxID=1129367 RepID=A0A0F6A5I0_9GAMM|nr:glycerol-3-phosphate 1-O-acyltransferase PlsB [Pseudoalteromonas luteoviolacea]AOT06576.1 glycerol-3-phosphate 1-O-acyltransferase [Pseudoalteromonas luteoviolacea]AOT11493.1 glycerol-3-phosphate 1-O-acyltransferase [Pseudoalteromonas luteoviolacea]AOT16406.1 glycerol-3-phosphate 1-O-acyltransferase [Pseudoalteromonas luteoviolacea]KKE81101.1 glycerol-3-phosphate acyltransferase [Pseudoalteromonas luteoviolacea S4054]KZN62491.1 glycerol-3-phosphate acyltransferase [Pseudoalteromonas luteovi
MRFISQSLNALARWTNWLLVKSKLLPENPIEQFGLDPNLPTFYVTRLNSHSDLAAIYRMCQQLGLPSPMQSQKIGNTEVPRFIAMQNPTPLFAKSAKPSNALQLSKDIFHALKVNPESKAQILPVSVFWGRDPGKEKPGLGTLLSHSLTPSWLRKGLVILFSGRDSLVRFSAPIAVEQLMNDKADVEELPQKLLRVARVHFRRQQLAATGPKLPSREALFNSILAAPNIKKAIAEEAKAKGLSHHEARLNAQELLDEIAANYSDAMVRVADRVLTWLWNKLYNGIEVKNADEVRSLADKGHEIIYVPCHRSHMDYLLLTYVIYHQGLVPPHIAAGVNLNFFPAGGIFRRSGAFFIRRSFAGNKLYSAVFKEYLSQLFIKGYSVKFYTEGGRSRTGRLLPPKTGMLAMTMQSMLRGIDRPISIVPVYIGYEHVMEINTYLKELAGNNKKNESVLGVFKAIKNLRNYGRGYLNFGQPINLNQYLNEHQPDWRQAITAEDAPKPQWLNNQVANVADQIMTNINASAALNVINVLATILLSNEQFALSKQKLLEQLRFYLALQKHAKYNAHITQPDEDAEALLAHALKLDKFEVLQDGLGDIITIKEKERTLFNYYRNNILHLFAVPSVLAQMLFNRYSMTVEECEQKLARLYPLFAKEWFLTPMPNGYIQEILTSFAQHELITFDGNKAVASKDNRALAKLEMLGKVCHLTLERYAITSSLVINNQGIKRPDLEKESDILANRLGTLHGIKSPEFFDKKVLSNFINALREQGFISISEQQTINAESELEELQAFLTELLPARIWQSINDTV